MHTRPNFLQTLTDDVRWYSFECLGDVDLCSVACTYRELLPQCTLARLHLYVARLNRRYQSLLSMPSRLRPGGGDSWSPKDGLSVQRVLKQLAVVAHRGDQATIGLCLPWMDSRDSATRSVAFKSIADVAERGDRRVIGKLLAAVQSGMFVEACCDALVALVPRGDLETVEFIHSLLRNGSPARIQYAALLALPSVVKRGDEAVVTTLIAKVCDKSSPNRGAAIQALGQIAALGDKRAMTCMISGLNDDTANVRNAAMHSLHVTSGGSFAAPTDDVISPKHLGVSAISLATALGACDWRTCHK